MWPCDGINPDIEGADDIKIWRHWRWSRNSELLCFRPRRLWNRIWLGPRLLQVHVKLPSFLIQLLLPFDFHSEIQFEHSDKERNEATLWVPKILNWKELEISFKLKKFDVLKVWGSKIGIFSWNYFSVSLCISPFQKLYLKMQCSARIPSLDYHPSSHKEPV